MAEAKLTDSLERHLLVIIGMAVILAAITASLLHLPDMVTVSAMILAFVIAILGAGGSARANKVDCIREQLEKLYAPMSSTAKAMLERMDNYLPRFIINMDSYLGSLYRHLAANSTLKAYDRRGEKGLTDVEWAKQLARIFLEDKEKLDEKYRRLTQE